MLRRALALAGMLVALVLPAQASLTVLVGEPFGKFGTMMPNGHIAIYLDRVCADGPTRLRMCVPGEPAGVAIARLDAIGKVDWVASPILPFLYATDDPALVLATTDAQSVLAMREQYRAANLQTLLPDGAEKRKANSDWWELAGAAYSRRLWGYRIDTTEAEDVAFVAWLNAQPNRHIYGVARHNCADFAAGIVNFYHPGTVKRSKFADLDIMSPKQVARCVAVYGEKHPEANLAVLEIPQVPGTLRRSRPVRGGAEGFLKTKRYLFTLIALQPEAVVALAVAYLDTGRWSLGRGAQVATAPAFESTPLDTDATR